MNRELVSSSFKISYPPGVLNPIDINESSLKEIGIIDEENPIDRNMLRIGSLGTNIFFPNEHEDEIKVYPNNLEIESKSKNRLKFILGKLQQKFGIIPIKTAEFRTDEHLLSSDFPEAVFKKYGQSGTLDVEAIQFRKENFRFYMYSCDEDTIHISSFSQNTNLKNFSDFNLNGDLRIDNLEKILDNFITTDLKIT